MSNKLSHRAEKKENTKRTRRGRFGFRSDTVTVGGARTEPTREVIEYLLAAVLLLLCVAVPLYAEDGYHQIGQAKFEAYRRIMLGGFGVLSVLAVVYYACRVIRRRIRDGKARTESAAVHNDNSLRVRLSVTDGFVLAYLILTGASVVSGGFYGDALWGAYGWNMGLLSQISFVLLYGFLSRFGKYGRVVLGALCVTAAVVFVIGILHRLLIDPIGFYDGLTNEQKAQFLSTLGQATWYAAFLVVTLPVGMGVFLYTEQKKWRRIAGIYMTIGFCTLVTQNSDSAYFALAGMLIVFFMISCEKRELLCRFAVMLALFFAAGKGMYLLLRIRSNPALEPDPVTRLMWTSGWTWGMLVLCLLATWILGTGAGKDRRPDFSATAVRRLRRGVLGIAAVLPVVVVLLIYLQSRGALPAGISERAAAVSYLNWNDDWGNGRGRIWRFACKVFSQENLRHKIFGVGPDCFHSYVTAYYGEEAALYWGEKMLTNAHNEWLNILINGGVLGAAAYGGIYVTAVWRCVRGGLEKIRKSSANAALLTGIGAAAAAYMCYNFFCYQQVLCTPFLFILMGIGEYHLRQEEAMEAGAPLKEPAARPKP